MSRTRSQAKPVWKHSVNDNKRICSASEKSPHQLFSETSFKDMIILNLMVRSRAGDTFPPMILPRAKKHGVMVKEIGWVTLALTKMLSSMTKMTYRFQYSCNSGDAENPAVLGRM